MDSALFDGLTRRLGRSHHRRAVAGVLGGSLATALAGSSSTVARKRKKKATLCLDGATIKASSKKKKKLLKGGATRGACGPCDCPANQVCDGGVCKPCSITCSGDAIACGAQLQQRLLDGGTIYACPGRYQGNFIMATARLIGAGSGDNPATATILDAAGTGRVIALGSNVTAELMSVRITGGKVPQYSGGGVLAQDGDLRMTNCAVVNNEASQGGGLYVSGAFRLTNSTVSGNTAFTGGGFRLQGTAAKFITDSVISGNKSTNFFGDGGGGILTAASTLSIIGTEISGNSANEKGGGIENISGAITMNAACRLLNNVSGDGGAIYTYPEGSVALNGATVTGNSEPQCKGMTC